MNCGDHKWRPDCPTCVRIRAWYQSGDTQAVVPRHLLRSPAGDAHALLVVAVLCGQPLPVIAAWCASILHPRAGPWATFTGPQSVMTARFWELAQECGEVTGADLLHAA